MVSCRKGTSGFTPKIFQIHFKPQNLDTNLMDSWALEALLQNLTEQLDLGDGAGTFSSTWTSFFFASSFCMLFCSQVSQSKEISRRLAD
jgi:hypothetical protein